jgi:hypothetical protein
MSCPLHASVSSHCLLSSLSFTAHSPVCVLPLSHNVCNSLCSRTLHCTLARRYNAYVDTFPFADDPDIFGLHPNANIAYQAAEGAEMLGNVLAVQPRLSSGAGEKSPDDVVFEVAEMIQSKMRSTILDLDLAKEGA